MKSSIVVVVVLPVLHEDADHLVAGALEQPRGHGGVDAAGEADDDSDFTIAFHDWPLSLWDNQRLG